MAAEEGKGVPLDKATRADMDRSFGADFGAVRIHNGSKAAELSRRLKAHAFTLGRNVFFNSGKYEPNTARGKRLLAHELTHVVQQGRATQEPVTGPTEPSDASTSAATEPSSSTGVPSAHEPPTTVPASEQPAAEAAPMIGDVEPAGAEPAAATTDADAPAEDELAEAEEGAEEAVEGAAGADEGAAAGDDDPAPKGKAKSSGGKRGGGGGGGGGGRGAVAAFLKRTTATTFRARSTAIGGLVNHPGFVGGS